MSLIKLKNINKIYGIKECSVTALNDINLEINKGDLVAIVGPSGSGKSTLLNIIGTIDKPSTGEYYINDENTSDFSDKQLALIRNKEIGFIVQHFALINDYTVYENIEIPLNYGKVKNKKIKIQSMVEKLGIKEKLNKTPKELSGGQCQRVAIARALVNDTQIILADEPTGALDSKTGQEVIDIFKKLNKEGKTIIIVTHDTRIASQCNKVIEMSDGKIVRINY